MKKRNIIWSLSLCFYLILSACSIFPPASVTPMRDNPGTGKSPEGNAPADNLQSPLAIGTLKLEGSNLAVSSVQANQLLPLWKNIRDSNQQRPGFQKNNQNVYQQIEKVMTEEQIQSIRNMSLTQTDIQDLLNKLKIQVTVEPSSFMGRSKPQQNNPGDQNSQGRSAQSGGTNNPGSGVKEDGTAYEKVLMDSLIQLLEKRAAGG